VSDGPDRAAPSPAGDDDARLLLDTGEALARAVAAAVPAWVERCVRDELDAWGGLGPGAEREAVLRRGAEAGRAAAAAVGPRLLDLVRRDVDDQATTPLSIVRGALSYPTAVLDDAGAPARRRDPFAAEHFPDDRYDLVPSSLAAVDPSLLDLAVTWGAAKAMAHRRRHGAPPRSGGGR
jgi:hypothetical protein